MTCHKGPRGLTIMQEGKAMTDKTLRDKLNYDYDPTDADAAMSVAFKALMLMESVRRALDVEESGLRLGRDLSGDLAVRTITLATALGLVEEPRNALEITKFWEGLRCR